MSSGTHIGQWEFHIQAEIRPEYGSKCNQTGIYYKMTQVPHLNDYAAAENWLISLTDYERLLGNAPVRYNTRTFDRDRFRTQMDRLGTPHSQYAVIHGAGTKGKGSTCALMEAALRECGLKTGLYTSPHLYRFTERIRINGREIPEPDFCDLIERMGREVMGQESEETGDSSFRTVFEILTAGALVWFAEQQVDVAIIETGLGGRLDSTNVFHGERDLPLINVITAIGLDHTAILGETITAIAGEKAGIIQRHGRTVVTEQADNDTEIAVREVIEAHCREAGAIAPVFVRQQSIADKTGDQDEPRVCPTFKFRDARNSAGELESALAAGLEVCPGLAGEHQLRNTATALRALMELERAWPEIPTALTPKAVAGGLAKVCWEGRFQRERIGNTDIIIDGAHCIMSARALASACKDYNQGRPVIALMGFLKDKAGADMLKAFTEILPLSAAVAVAPPSVRSMSAEEIAETMRIVLRRESSADSPTVQSTGSVADGMQAALNLAVEENGYVIVFGSLYLVGPALDAIKDIKQSAGDR